MRKTVYLLRHGDTGVRNAFVGASDISLDQSSLTKLDGVKKELGRLSMDAVFCSPMRRCLQTVEYLGLLPDAQRCEELREIDFGAWEGLSFNEIAGKYPDHVAEWAAWSATFGFPGGEKKEDFLQRIKRIKKEIDTVDGERVLVVSHGGVIRQLICAYLNLASKNYLLFDIRAGRYATIDVFDGGGGVLTSLNMG